MPTNPLRLANLSALPMSSRRYLARLYASLAVPPGVEPEIAAAEAAAAAAEADKEPKETKEPKAPAKDEPRPVLHDPRQPPHGGGSRETPRR
jgi:hypothetical protein